MAQFAEELGIFHDGRISLAHIAKELSHLEQEAWLHADFDDFADTPGEYIILEPDTPVTEGALVRGPDDVFDRLDPGTRVTVVEIVTISKENSVPGFGRVRGRLESPPGWIALCDDNFRWAKKQDLDADMAEPVPLEWTWLLFRRARVENYFVRFVLYILFCGLFTAIFQGIRPVNSHFTVQDTLLEHTSRESLPNSRWSRTFRDITTAEEWFSWVEEALLPSILVEEYYNGDSRNLGNVSWGKRFMNTVSMYNTQTVPIRFRQVRVTDDSCDTPTGNSLARPCWGAFSRSNQYKNTFGTSYGNTYLTNLIEISTPSQAYGSQAHVVDVQLDKATALSTVRQMSQDRWINEQTRMVTIETSWYNANLDLSTSCSWILEIFPGGRFATSVVINSCRLNPYATTPDQVRMVFEVLFVWILVYYLADTVFHMRSLGKKFFFSVWNWLEIINVLMFIVILCWWAAFLIEDKKPFEVVSTAVNNDRPDLNRLTGHFAFMANFSAFNIVFSYIKVFKYMQIFPSIALLWRTLRLAAMDTWPFLLVFLLFTCGFAFAGHWMFGLLMKEFHTWPTSFVTLFLTMVGGYPYDSMKEVAPLAGPTFTVAWVLIMVMVIANMFVAILSEWYHRVVDDSQVEETALRQKAGDNAKVSLFRWMWTFITTTCRVRRTTEYDVQEKEVRRMLKKADMHNTDHLRQALVDKREVVAAELRDHFGGDARATAEFVQKVRRLAEIEDAQSGGVGSDDVFGEKGEEIEEKEQEQLKKLQKTVERLEDHVKLLRSALHNTGAAPTRTGQSLEGYLLEAVKAKTSPESPRSQPTGLQELPGVPGPIS